jgi:hypothetical protein
MTISPFSLTEPVMLVAREKRSNSTENFLPGSGFSARTRRMFSWQGSQASMSEAFVVRELSLSGMPECLSA